MRKRGKEAEKLGLARRAMGVFLRLWAARPRGAFLPLGEGGGGEARGFTDGQKKAPVTLDGGEGAARCGRITITGGVSPTGIPTNRRFCTF